MEGVQYPHRNLQTERNISSMYQNQFSSRRRFLGTAFAVGIAAPFVIPRSVLAQPGQAGANDKIIVGFVGTGGRARQLMTHIPKGRAKIVAISDFWKQKMIDTINEKKKEQTEGGFENIDQWKMYDSDIAMYEKEKLDCAFVATQDFTRTIACCRAILAGHDVYAEKALTAYIAEGRALVNFVRKHKTVFQVGSQQRSMSQNRYGCALLRDGKLGKVNEIWARNYGSPRPIPKNLPEQPIPEGLNWDAWQGPTEYRPYNQDLTHWMTWQEYNGGDMTNWGAHGVDQIQWAMGADGTGPVEFWPIPKEEWMPNTGERSGRVAAKYANGVVVKFELDPGPEGGAVFRCEKGNLEINRNILRANPESLVADAPALDPLEADDRPGLKWNARPHIENFFDCIASRNLPVADVEIGHRSITFCHLVGITRRLNRKLQWDPVKEQFVGDDEANTLVDRPRRKGYELPS